MQRQAPSPLEGRRHLIWLAVMVGVSMVFTLGLACAVPLAAFAGAAAVTSSRRNGLVLVASVWLANQVVGFTVLDYPWTASTFAWGVALGMAAVLATLAAHQTATPLSGAPHLVGLAGAFLIAFAVYEAALFVISATLLGGTEIYTIAIQGWIFVVNALAFPGLLVLHRLAVSVGFALRPTMGRSLTESRA